NEYDHLFDVKIRQRIISVALRPILLARTTRSGSLKLSFCSARSSMRRSFVDKVPFIPIPPASNSTTTRILLTSCRANAIVKIPRPVTVNAKFSVFKSVSSKFMIALFLLWSDPLCVVVRTRLTYDAAGAAEGQQHKLMCFFLTD